MYKDRCRTCNHIIEVHLNDNDGTECNYGWLVGNNKCHCREYLPLDNLEYLEYRYEQQSYL